ncbi:MAG: tRNA (adenosine(37)-N6)-threonylcarbamoyltransferase complex ATPase subunit type 1 TsaE [Chitinophagales bacterium]|nr:tRNA (adenosine(37)-N6)-threonylcarbamoyltransferase complex ATPase subunit type 1 TsaE [Chitinophagales bacterium]
MKRLTFIYSLEELPLIAQSILQNIGLQKVIVLEGHLGAGKTTLIKEIIAQLGSTDLVSSPTYTIVNTYLYPKGEIYHIDAYRLKSDEEALDIGIDEILYSGEMVWIEWPQIIEHLLPEGTVYIKITLENNQRKLTLQIP